VKRSAAAVEERVSLFYLGFGVCAMLILMKGIKKG
jgi:hypothetical protein